MPYGDRTGPMGMGSRSGRALGFCTGFDSPGYVKGGGRGMNYGGGRGRGRGYGEGMRGGRGVGYGGGMRGGRGMGYGGGIRGGRGGRPGAGWGYGRDSGYPALAGPQPWMPAMGKEDEIEMLKAEIKAMEHSRKAIEKRLEELAGKE